MSRRCWLLGGKALAAVVTLVLAIVPVNAEGQDVVGFDALASVIVDRIGEARPVRLALERFERQPEGIENPLTYEIRHKLAQALDAIEGVELVALDGFEARRRANEAFASNPSLTQGGPSVDYLVKGAVLVGEDGYRLLVDIVQPATARLLTETAWIEGDASLAASDQQIAHRAASMRTIREVDELSRVIGQDFRLRLWVGDDGRQTYRVGESIEYYLSSERDAYVAVICHQHDGASYPLLPNSATDDNFFRGGEVASIDRNDEFEIEASTLGVDVIQAIACEERALIDRIVETYSGRVDVPAASPHRSPVERSALLNTLRWNLRGRTEDRCSSTTIKILVSEQAVGVGSTVRVKIRGLDSVNRKRVMSILEMASGVRALNDQAVADDVWLLEVTGTVLASELEEMIASQLPSPLVLLEKTPGGLEFGSPVEDRYFGKLCFLFAMLFATLRWLTS